MKLNSLSGAIKYFKSIAIVYLLILFLSYRIYPPNWDILNGTNKRFDLIGILHGRISRTKSAARAHGQPTSIHPTIHPSIQATATALQWPMLPGDGFDLN